MPVPLPDAMTVNLVPPDLDEIHLMIRGLATAGAAPDGLTEVQRAVVNATVESMSGFVVDVGGMDPLGPREFAEAMRRRNLPFRERMVQLMLLLELLLNPLPAETTARVEQYAAELGGPMPATLCLGVCCIVALRASLCSAAYSRGVMP